MIARPYQTRSIELVRASMRAGHRKVILVVPTGGGKSFVGATICASAVAKGSRVLWLSHRRELVAQASRALAGCGLHVGVLSADVPELADVSAPTQVASIQTMAARTLVRPPADLIVWDECHHACDAAPTWSAILHAYPDARVLGLTATPERGDGSGLAPLFTDLVVGVTVRQLTADGHLVPCEIIRPSTWLKAKGVGGNPLAQDPVAAWLEHAGKRQGFMFARSVEEAQGYASRLSEAGVSAACIHAKTPSDERSSAIESFRKGSLKCLCNVFVFTEGTDLPAAAVCCLAKGASTAGGMLQMVGRVLRPAPGKTSALLIDLQGTTHVHGVPEDDRLYRLSGRAIVKADRLCPVCKSPCEEFPCTFCGYVPTGDDAPGAESTITGDPLMKYARKIAEGPDQRRETLERWLRAAYLKGYKAASVRHKYKAVYQEEPPREWFDEIRGRVYQ